jgi:glycogen debranching enzyme
MKIMHHSFDTSMPFYLIKPFLLSCLIVSLSLAQTGTIPAFRLEPNELELTRLAQPGAYFDKVGRRFAVLGYESGTFEAWAYPLKLYRNVELSFLVGSSTEPIKGRDIVRRIHVTPEATVLVYTYQSFTVRTIFVTPIDEPGGFILLAVQTTEPLNIVCSFLPVLQPMWPAGIGGQSARWLDDVKAYQISEPTRRNTAYIGSPAASGISYTPAHMLSDQPNQFKIEIRDPSALTARYIPIVMAGGRGSRDSIKAIYQRLTSDPERYYRQNVEHYGRLRASTLQIQTPHQQLNLAFEWAKVAYDNLIVENPDLGRGMVAGLGTSGTGGRPGFGWFFGGDTYINSFSMLGYGVIGDVRDALAFTEKWQRADGKMAHELTQAAAYVDWWKDYPYGYIHGDTSPFYIASVHEYYLRTNDTAFVRRSWNSLKRAYEWSISTDENGDGLMDNKKAGLGALEYGPLIDIQSDIYTSAVWLRALMGLERLTRDFRDDAFLQNVRTNLKKAHDTFKKKFWDEKNKQYAYAFTANDERVDIVSPWSAVGLMWRLGEPEKSVLSLKKLNSAELTTDWGIRSISNKSRYYEPLNYNYGAVWPFLTSWVATAQFRHGFMTQGYGSLLSSVRHTFDNSLGQVTEVFSGTHNIWPQEAVAHQGFCTAGVVLPFLSGLMGIEADAPAKRVTLSPSFPADWDTVTFSNLAIGDEILDGVYRRTETTLRLELTPRLRKGYTIMLIPQFGPGTSIRRVTVNGQPASFQEEVLPHITRASVEFLCRERSVIQFEFVPTVEILLPQIETLTGDMNKGLKIITQRRFAKVLEIILEGLAGESYLLPLRGVNNLVSVEGARRVPTGLRIDFPAGPDGEFVRKTIGMTVDR